MILYFFKTDIDNLLKYENSTYVNDTKTSERKGVELALYQDIGNIKIRKQYCVYYS